MKTLLYNCPMILNLPNILTLLRLAMLPFIVALIFRIEDWAAWTALGLYALGSFTDWLDGWIARRYNMVSAFGTFMDPISDKIYVAVIMLTLVASGHVGMAGIIMIMLIFVREFTVSGLREYLGPRNVKLPVSKLAKWKTTVQMVATGLFIVAPMVDYGLEAATGMLAVATLLTLVTGWDYLRIGFAHMNDNGPKKK